MPSIEYVGPSTAVMLDGIVCKRGDIVVFPEHITAKALEQDCWSTPKRPSSPTIISKSTKEIA